MTFTKEISNSEIVQPLVGCSCGCDKCNNKASKDAASGEGQTTSQSNNGFCGSSPQS